ncbi:MAG: hypothetical protein V2I48_17710 [Xanthomonadales bacterium]|jgi:hypothetical protein|nr:hypothetical protein [Xanthomonadales bacterium]
MVRPAKRRLETWPCFILLALSMAFGISHVTAFEMAVLETEDLRLLYFEPQQTYLAPYVARNFHNSLEFQRYILDWTPWEKTTVVLKDFADYGNAGALVSPRNMVIVDIAPASRTLETLPANERMYMLMNHEMVHVATSDGWNETDAWWRRIFGGKPIATGEHPESILYNYLATPRHNAPRWYLEGSATFMETWMSGGIGRAQGAYDEMVFRSMVRDDAHFYSNLGLVSRGTSADFQVGVNAYLYGTRFISYLALQYSPGQVIEWLSRDQDSKRYYSAQFRDVFGQPLEDAWDDWIAWERSFQADNLQMVREAPLTPGRRLTPQALGSVSKSYIDVEQRTMIGAFRYPGVVAHIGIMSLEDGSIERLEDIKGPALYSVTSTAFDAKSRTLFYTSDNRSWRDLMAIDVDSGETRSLLEDVRVGDLAFNPADRSIWGLRHADGYVTLVRIPHPYDNWDAVHTFPYGQVLYELDLSHDGQMLSASMGEIDGQQFLRVFRTGDLLNGNAEPFTQFDFGVAVPEGFVFSSDGQFLFGSAYYTGVSNLFRYEIANGDIVAVTNAETGFFRPMPLEDGRLVALEYTGQGFTPVLFENPQPLEDLSAINFLGNEIVKKHPIVRDWVAGSPADVPLDDLVINRGVYVPRREMEYANGYPIVEGYRDSLALGWNLTLQDPMMLSSLNATVSYSIDNDLPSDEKLHVDVEYRTMGWRFRYWHNFADFYDLFGPTERARKGDAFIVGHERALILDEPRQLDLKFSLGYYTGLDTLPDNQNVPTSFEKLVSARLGLDYKNTRSSLGALDHEKGFRWDAWGYGDYADDEFVYKGRAGFDVGFATPWKHSSIWLYNSAGIAEGDEDNALAYWFFGGFGNNYVDDGDIRRYRNYYSFPGFEIDELYGQDFAKTMLEWNLPPYRFHEVGIPSFYLAWLRPALFAGYMSTDISDGKYRENYQSIGFQLDLRFTVVHKLPMTLSVGFARGYIDGDKYDDEVMFSLKIL